MKKHIRVKRLSTGSVFKLVAIGMLIPICVIFTISGAFALCGMQWLYINGIAIQGVHGFLEDIIAGPFIWLVVTLYFGTMMVVGLGLYSLMRPIEVIDRLAGCRSLARLFLIRALRRQLCIGGFDGQSLYAPADPAEYLVGDRARPLGQPVHAHWR